MKNPPKGFTLIELLVVIAIISLLSSVVLTSLSSSRRKAQDTAIIAEVVQLRTLMMTDFAETGTFANIKAGGAWKVAGSVCDPASFTGNNAQEAAKICSAIMSQLPSGIGCVSSCLYFQSTSPNSTNNFTIMAYLPGESKKAGVTQYFCIGSSGRSSIGPTNSWLNEGCYANP